MNNTNTTELDKKVRELLSQLPEPYQKAVRAMDLNQKVESIAEKYNLSEDGLINLDREVTYLLLRVQTTIEFMNRIEKKVGLSEQSTARITNGVTDKIIQPLNKKIESFTADNQSNIPVPTPPSQDDEPPKPEYGGRSDPYREPPE